jgi:hypothetical protein
VPSGLDAQSSQYKSLPNEAGPPLPDSLLFFVAVAVIFSTHLMSVLMFFESTSYILLTASLICLLLAFTSTINTKVLFSSILRMADSVFRGNLRMAYWSRRGVRGMDLRGYLGVRARRRVLGRRKVVDVRILRFTTPLVPLSAAFFAAFAVFFSAFFAPVVAT